MSALSRRTFVKDAGGLLIGFSLVDSTVVPRLLAQAPGSVKAPSASRLDAWLRIEQGGSVRVFTGKLEIGMGVDTAFTQIVAEELDVAATGPGLGDDAGNRLKVSGAGFGLNVEGAAKPKDPGTYTIVGTSLPRVDEAPKVLGQHQYVTDVRVPGMLHGRVVRPAGVGAKLVRVDKASVP